MSSDRTATDQPVNVRLHDDLVGPVPLGLQPRPADLEDDWQLIRLKEFIQYVSQFKGRLIGLGIATLLVSFVILVVFKAPEYEARLNFFVTDDYVVAPENMTDPGGTFRADAMHKKAEIVNLVNFGQSDEVMTRVMKRLLVLEEQVMRQSLTFFPDEVFDPEEDYQIYFGVNNQISIAVTNPDPQLAIRICEVIYNQLSEMDNSYYLEVMNGRQDVCQKQWNFFNNKVLALRDSLGRVQHTMGLEHDSWSSVEKGGIDLTLKEKKLIAYQSTVVQLLAEIKRFQQRLEFFENESYENSLIIEFLEHRKPIILSRDVPDPEQFWVAKMALLSMVFTLIYLVMSLIILYVTYVYRDYIKVIFNREFWTVART